MKVHSGNRKVLVAVFCLAMLVSAAAWGRTTFGAAFWPTHLNKANTLVYAVQPSINNQYDDDGISNNSYITWDGSAAWTNCATFVSLLLQHSYNWSDADLKARWDSTSPTAAKYHDEIEAQHSFTQITLRSQIQAGDIMAIKYPNGASATGHVMVIADAPVLRTATNPQVANTTQYEVSVIDSSSSFHGSLDTRNPNNGGGSEGIGKGIFRIYVDANDQIVGYTWSTAANSTYYAQAQRHLVVGRLQP